MRPDIDHLYTQLSNVRERFLAALSSGEDALTEFDRYWSTLITQVMDCVEAPLLLQLAHNCATFIAACADSVMACEVSTASMISETEDALARHTEARTRGAL